MERRPLGRSGVEVPVLGFGCGGSARLMVGDDHAARVAAVEAAIECGINYFDTAPAYGDGRSEANLGAVLADVGSPPVTLSTKVVLREEELARPRDAVLRSVEESLRRLRVDRVEMLLLHNRIFRDRPSGRRVGVGPALGLGDVLEPGGVMDGFQELLRAGTIAACGFTTLGGDPSAIREVLDSGEASVINAALSLVEPTSAWAVAPPAGGDDHGQVVPAAQARGIGVIAVRVFGSGRLLVAPTEEATATLQGMAAELGGGDVIRGSLAFALGTPGVGTAVIGFSEEAHVRQAASAVREGLPELPSTADLIDRLNAVGS